MSLYTKIFEINESYLCRKKVIMNEETEKIFYLRLEKL